MARQAGAKTIKALVEASQAIISEEGVERLTLDAVVRKVGMSKGAILYHFKSKDDLARRILDDAIEAFDRFVTEIQGDDAAPGAYTRAYVKAALAPADTENIKIFQAIAALSRDQKLKGVYAAAINRWSRMIEADGLDPMKAEMIRLAADGLWVHESADAPPLAPAIRERLVRQLLDLAQ